MKKICAYNVVLFSIAVIAFLSCKKDDPAPSPDPLGANQFLDSRDNKIYNTVTIGNQTWMAENLNYQSPSAGNKYCYNANSDSCKKYGALYDWEAANVVCPNGWRLPSDRDWQALEFQLGMAATDTSLTSFRGTDQGTKLKEKGTSGFNGKLSGYYLQGDYSGVLENAGFWTSTPSISNSANAYYRLLDMDEAGIFRDTYYKTAGLCVRCIKK